MVIETFQLTNEMTSGIASTSYYKVVKPSQPATQTCGPT